MLHCFIRRLYLSVNSFQDLKILLIIQDKLIIQEVNEKLYYGGYTSTVQIA